MMRLTLDTVSMVRPQKCIKPPTSTSESKTMKRTSIDEIRFPMKIVVVTNMQIIAKPRFKYSSLAITSSVSQLIIIIIRLDGDWWMLKQPPLKSLSLYILVFQDRSERGAFNMFKKCSRIRIKIVNGFIESFYSFSYIVINRFLFFC